MNFRKIIIVAVATSSALTALCSNALQNAAADFNSWSFECRPDGKKLRLPKIDANTYRSYLLKVKGDAVQMIHDDPDPEVAHQGIFFTKHPGLLSSGILVAEWNAAILKAAEKPGMPVFQAVLTPANNDGEVWYPFAVRFSPQGVSTQAGTVQRTFPENEFHTFRAAVDPESGEFILWLDNEIIQQGSLPRVKKVQKPMIAIGDGSGAIAGQAALRYFNAGTAVKPPESVAGLKEAAVEWAFEFDRSNKTKSLPEIDANSYRSDLLTVDESGIHMIHDVADQQYQGIFLGGHPKLRSKGIVVAEWEVAVQKAAEKESIAVFNVNLAPAGENGLAKYQTNILFAPGQVSTKAGIVSKTFPVGEFHRFRAAVNPENGEYTLWMDGETLLQGKLRPVKAPAKQIFAFGDCSGVVNGQAVLRYFRIGKI